MAHPDPAGFRARLIGPRRRAGLEQRERPLKRASRRAPLARRRCPEHEQGARQLERHRETLVLAQRLLGSRLRVVELAARRREQGAATPGERAPTGGRPRGRSQRAHR